MSLTSESSGVSARRMSSSSTGTKARYLLASLASFGPVVRPDGSELARGGALHAERTPQQIHHCPTMLDQS
jgi:hypothetical protein